LGTGRFVTFDCHHQLPLLASDETALIFLRELQVAKTKYALKLFAFVIMPEHVHLVVHPQKKIELGRVIGELKSLSGRRISDHLRSVNSPLLESLEVLRNRTSKLAIWLRRCYDHNCRTQETVLEKINYVHNNPVKAGLVDDPEEWPWSSYRWYQGKENKVIEIDTLF
jgi:putative transposase